MPPATAVEMVSAELAFTFTEVPVDDIATQIVGENRQRKYLLIVNRSTERIDIKVDEAPILTEGIPLNPTAANSNSINDDIQGAYEWSGVRGNLTLKAVYGICTNGTKTVSVIEGVPIPTP